MLLIAMVDSCPLLLAHYLHSHYKGKTLFFCGATLKPLKLLVVVSLFLSTRFSYAIEKCDPSLTSPTVLQPAQFYKLLLDKEFTLNPNLSLEQKLILNGFSLDSPIYSELIDLSINLLKLKNPKDHQLYTSERLKITPARAERVLLAIDRELKGVRRNHILGIKHVNFRSRRPQFQNFKLKLRDKESLDQWVQREQEDLLSSYTSYLSTRLLNDQNSANGRPLMLNSVPELDSAQALSYIIEENQSLLGAHLIIKGFYHVDLPGTALLRSGSYHYYYYLLRFVNQLLRLEKPLSLEGKVFYPESIFIQTKGGPISLKEFKDKYRNMFSYDHNVRYKLKSRRSNLVNLLSDRFLNLIVPDSDLFSSNGKKDFKILNLKVSLLHEKILQDQFSHMILHQNPNLLKPYENHRDLFVALHSHVFYPSFPRKIGAHVLKVFVAPSYALPPIDSKEGASKGGDLKDDSTHFFAEEHRVFKAPRTGGAKVLNLASRYLAHTENLYQRLHQIIRLIPKESTYQALKRQLGLAKVKHIKLNQFEQDFWVARKAYVIVKSTMKKFNDLAMTFNREKRDSQKLIPLINLSDLTTAEGLNKALDVVRRYTYLLARHIENSNPSESRRVQIEKIKMAHDRALKTTLKEVSPLDESSLELFRGDKYAQQEGAIDVLAKVAEILGQRLFIPGNAQALMNSLYFLSVQEFKKDLSTKYWNDLKKRLQGIKFGNQDAHNSRKTSKVAAERIYSYLVLLARAVSMALNQKSHFNPERMYDPYHLDLFFRSIPSLHGKLVQNEQARERNKERKEEAHKRQLARKSFLSLSPKNNDFVLSKESGILITFKRLNKVLLGKMSLRSSGSLQRLYVAVLNKVKGDHPESRARIDEMRVEIKLIYPSGKYLHDGNNAASSTNKYAGTRYRVYHLYRILFEGIRDISSESDVSIKDTTWFVNQVLK